MKLSVERKAASLVALDITADDDEFAAAVNKAYRKAARDIQVPGFRKGKAPRTIIEQFYGRDVFVQDAADDMMETLFRKAIEQEELTPVGEPEVEIKAINPLSFVVTIPVYPEVDTKDYVSVRVDPVDAAVEDADVDETLERMRVMQSPWVDVTDGSSPQEGDQVTVDYEVAHEGEPFQDPVVDASFILGETNLLAQLREKIEQMRLGESASFDITFAEDDETANESIRGMTLAYSVTLKAHQRRDLVELDDDFAQKVNEDEESTVEALREQVREELHVNRTTEGRSAVLDQIVDQMAAQAEIDPPAVMVEKEVELQLQHLRENLMRSNTPWEGYLRFQGKTEQDLKEDARPQAEQMLRRQLFLSAFAKSEGIEVTSEDVEAEIARVSGPPAGSADEDDEAATRRERMAQFFQSDYYRSMLQNELQQRKVTDRLIEIATEGRGAVLNGWSAPDPADDEAVDLVEVEASAEADVFDTETATDAVAPDEAENEN